MKKIPLLLVFVLSMGLVSACGSFQAKRVDSSESDEKAMQITDQWVQGDTEKVINDVIKQMQDHKSFKRFLKELGRTPKVFVGEVQNLTSEAYFPINDVNDEFLNKLSSSGDFTLVDAEARGHILKEITYQNDGMVDPSTAKKVGKQLGADLMIFGNVFMKPATRDGKTIKEYVLNIRMTNIETATEVLRVRAKNNKYSEQKGSGW